MTGPADAQVAGSGITSVFPDGRLERERGRESLPARSATLIVIGLTTAGFGLRLAGVLREALVGDEVFLYRIVSGHSLGQALDVVQGTEKTPPLGFILAWLASQLGDATTTSRLPSLLFGTALIPLVYLVGVRTVGRSAGVLGAAVMALSPFAVFYGVENRAYATAACMVVLATLLLLVATERGRWWWTGYAGALAACLYTHYTTVFPLIALTGWALFARRDRRKQILLASAGALALFAAWIPGFIDQYRISGDEAGRINATNPLTLANAVRAEVKSLVGHPFMPLSTIPGDLALGLIGAAFVVTTAVLVGVARRSGGPAPGRLTDTGLLIMLLAVAAPVGVVIYSLRPGVSLLLPRNLFVSAPFAGLLAGWAIASAGRRTTLLAGAIFVVALGAAGASTLPAAHRRLAYDDAADYIRARLRPGDAVGNLSFGLDAGAAGLYLRGIPVYDARTPEIFTRTRPGSSLWVMVRMGVVPIPSVIGPDRSFRRASIASFPGSLAVIRYVNERPRRHDNIRLSSGSVDDHTTTSSP